MSSESLHEACRIPLSVIMNNNLEQCTRSLLTLVCAWCRCTSCQTKVQGWKQQVAEDVANLSKLAGATGPDKPMYISVHKGPPKP